MPPRPPSALRVARVVGLGLACAVATLGHAQVAPANPPPPAGKAAGAAAEPPVMLAPIGVQERLPERGVEPAALGSPESQLRDPVFASDLLSPETLEEDPAGAELLAEMGLIANPSPVELATGDSRVGLRGFPTPLLSNGFVRQGGIDLLNTGRTFVIQGALVPVLGRGAPGGIQDYWTNRPRTTPSRTFSAAVGSLDRQSAAFEWHGLTVPQKAWHRVAADWSRKAGPEEHAVAETRAVSGAVTWRHGPDASTLVAVDFSQLHATPAAGIPEYRVAPGARIVGPYRPLAGFNAQGPYAGVRRRSVVAGAILEARVHPQVIVRASAEAWWRRIEQDRFTTGLLNLATGRFEGIREPIHSEQPQRARVARADATARFSLAGSEHKLLVALSHTEADNQRDERALPVARRNALPATVRTFNPFAPDYTTVPYDRAGFDRVLADRAERTRFTALEVSERMSLARGRTVLTGGLRQDLVGLRVTDRRPGVAANLARVRDGVDELTWHLGVNHQAVPSRLLLFATTSTAFNPSTRVDARTGHIQGNETTFGYEAGAKARLAEGRVDLTASAFTFINRDISRRNPLYGDPLQDANHTQPQLVAAGEERFTGGKLEGRWRVTPAVSLSFVGSHVRAVTTASPDLPEEVGRRLSRFPPYNAALSASYAFPEGRWRGLSLSGSWAYLSDFTAFYADRQRFGLEYPGYGLLHLGASYSLRAANRTHSFGLTVRNALDRDLLASHDRLGAEREFGASYRVTF